MVGGENNSRKFLFLSAAAMLIALIFLAILVWQFFLLSDAQNKINAQGSQIQSLQGQTENLTKKVSGLFSAKSRLEYELDSTRSVLNLTQTTLQEREAKINALNLQIAQAQANLSEAQGRIDAQRQSIQSLLSEINDVQSSLNSTWQWLRENAYLPANYSWEATTFKERVMEDCTDGQFYNLGCVSYRMETNALAMHYKRDIDAGKVDHLQSLTETINRQGGDCEDYALFVKAILNTVKNKTKGLSLLAWGPGGGEFIVYPRASSNPTSYTYYSNASGFNLGSLDSLYPYVVCYSLPDAGHCTVAVSENQINSSSQINLLYGARVFEPQNGKYLGIIGKQFGVCDPQKTGNCRLYVNDIFLVISDDDIYQAYSDKWTGQKDYAKKLSQFMESLKAP